MSIRVFLHQIGYDPKDFKEFSDNLLSLTKQAPKDSTLIVELGNNIKYVNGQLIGSGFELYLEKSKLYINRMFFYQHEIIEVFKQRIENLEVIEK